MPSVGPAGRKASLFHPGTHRLPLHARPSQGGHGEVPCKEQGQVRRQRLLLALSQWLLPVLINVWKLYMQARSFLSAPLRNTIRVWPRHYQRHDGRVNVYLKQHDKLIKDLPLSAIKITDRLQQALLVQAAPCWPTLHFGCYKRTSEKTQAPGTSFVLIFPDWLWLWYRERECVHLPPRLCSLCEGDTGQVSGHTSYELTVRLTVSALMVCSISVASPLYGAGQQCCYDSNGTQVLTGDSIGGSTPDRAHDWGSPPYDKPPHVPGQSHWLYDVLSFYYCCLWSDNCQFYFKHRPSSDCRRYRPPSTGLVAQQRCLAPYTGLFSSSPRAFFFFQPWCSEIPTLWRLMASATPLTAKGNTACWWQRRTWQSKAERSPWRVRGHHNLHRNETSESSFWSTLKSASAFPPFLSISKHKCNKTDVRGHERILFRYCGGASSQRPEQPGSAAGSEISVFLWAELDGPERWASTMFTWRRLCFARKEKPTNANRWSPRRVCVFPLSHKRDGDVPQRSRGGGAPQGGNHDDHCAPAGVVQQRHQRAAGKDERRPRRRPHAQQRPSGAEPKRPRGGVQLRCQL